MSNLVAVSDQSSFLSVIEKVISNPNSSVEMLDKILDAQERIMNKNAEIAFNADLSVMLNDIPVIAKTSEAKVVTKTGGNFGIKYASLDEIVEVVRPIMSKYGFSVNFEHMQPSQSAVTITCVLRHKMGHSIKNEIILPIDVSGAKNAVQSVGSTITYGKRYTLCSLLNIATGDDKDGFTVKADQANKKLKIDEVRFENAIVAVKTKKFKLCDLISGYDLTEDQKDRLDKEFGSDDS